MLVTLWERERVNILKIFHVLQACRCGALQNPQVFRVTGLRPSNIFFPFVCLFIFSNSVFLLMFKFISLTVNLERRCLFSFSFFHYYIKSCSHGNWLPFWKVNFSSIQILSAQGNRKRCKVLLYSSNGIKISIWKKHTHSSVMALWVTLGNWLLPGTHWDNPLNGLIVKIVVTVFWLITLCWVVR